jgi:hypothetical protein
MSTAISRAHLHFLSPCHPQAALVSLVAINVRDVTTQVGVPLRVQLQGAYARGVQNVRMAARPFVERLRAQHPRVLVRQPIPTQVAT